MPEVYTKENKKYYTQEMCKKTYNLTPEEVYEYRKYFVNHTKKEVYQKYLLDHDGETTLAYKTFGMILSGDVRPSSNYLLYPVYNKKKQKWSNE